jgi:diguanylate cyclase (GGDEF)-like protein/PAS domain S-box-containing protein
MEPRDIRGFSAPGLDLELLLQAMDSLNDGVMVTDAEQRIVAVNTAVCTMTGYTREELVGSTARRLQGPGTQPERLAEIRHAVRTGGRFVGELVNYRKDGTLYWNGMSIAPILRDGVPTHFVSMQRDITNFVAQRTAVEIEHVTTEMMLSVARALSGPTEGRDVTQIIADAVPALWGAERSVFVLWDAVRDRFVVASMHGWDGVIAEELAQWEGTRSDSTDLTALMDSGQPALVKRRSSEWARSVIDHFGFEAMAVVPVQISGRFLGILIGHWAHTPPPGSVDDTLLDRMTGLAGLAGIALDQARLQQAIDWSSLHDPLTRLANRRMLEQHITEALDDLGERGESGEVTVLACEVDRFARISDSYVTDAVDSLLREIAERIMTAARPAGFVGRLGGESFAIVVRGAPHVAEAVAADVIRAFEDPFRVGDDTVHVDVSLGSAASADVTISDAARKEPFHAMAAQRLVSLASADLKARRGNGVVDGLPGDPDEARLDTDIRSAVRNGEIEVHYQPQVRFSDGALVGVEALARWNHPVLGQVSPARFIPLAELNGVIREIGRFVLETACADGARWTAAGHPIEVSINVAVHQLEDPGFADTVMRVVEATGFVPQRLTIEVTEPASSPIAVSPRCSCSASAISVSRSRSMTSAPGSRHSRN